MGYFFGKDDNADPSSLLTGAYNFSMQGSGASPAGRTASPTGSPMNPPEASPTPVGENPDWNGMKCMDACYAKFNMYSQPKELEDCLTNCKGVPGYEEKQKESAAGCPEGSGAAYEGCPCGTEYYTKIGNCPTGYGFIAKTDKPGYVGKCYCQKWVAETDTGAQGGTLGEYQPPSQISDLMNMLLGRSKELLGTAPGYSQDAIDAMFGRNFENIRAGERGTRNTLTDLLSGQGMLGTGTALGAMNKNAWNTEGNIGNLSRDLLIANEDKKKEDLINLSGAAQSLFGSGLQYENLLEAINASRRGEGSAAIAMLLQYWKSLVDASGG